MKTDQNLAQTAQDFAPEAFRKEFKAQALTASKEGYIGLWGFTTSFVFLMASLGLAHYWEVPKDYVFWIFLAGLIGFLAFYTVYQVTLPHRVGVEAKDARIAELETESADWEKEARRLDDMVTEIKAENAELQAIKRDFAEAKRQNAENAEQRFKEEIKGLKTQIQTLTLQEIQARKEVVSLKEQLENERQQVGNTSQKIGELNLKLGTLPAENQRLQSQNETLKRQNEHLQSELETLKNSTPAASEDLTKVSELEAQISVLNSVSEQQISEIQRLKQNADNEISVWNGKISVLQNEISVLRNDLKSSNNRVGGKDRHLKQYKEKYQALLETFERKTGEKWVWTKPEKPQEILTNLQEVLTLPEQE